MVKGQELFVPAVITKVHTFDPGEFRKIELTLPPEFEVQGKTYPIHDRMRPGTAFLAKPMGVRTTRFRRRMYTRSNCAFTAARALETIINDTHHEKADTSPWWQTEEVEKLHQIGGTIDVRVDFDDATSELVVYENSYQVEPTNLRLEVDADWSAMRILAIAFSTGITPFLSHLRYMSAFNFGRATQQSGVQFILVVSVRHPRQLMDHQELLDLAHRFPENFRYHPVLTREWPDSWNFGRGRIIRMEKTEGGEERVNLSPLLALVTDISQFHVRMCGNASARDQLVHGFHQTGNAPVSFRAEVW